MRAVVVALGKIGLPIAAQLARTGHDVTGCDIDPRVVDAVNAGRSPFSGEAGLDEALAEAVAAGRLRAMADTAAAVATGPDLVVAVPPLMVDAAAEPDWRALDAVIADIGRGLRAGTTVSVETTVPVGTTRARLAPALAAESGLRPEEDFHTVFSPERVYSGRVFSDLASYPKLVGGLSAAGEARGAELYRAFLDAEVRPMGGAEAAELTKLVETTYRDVNIALANEFARHADELGLDVQHVIDAANSQPFSHVHRPGVAVGGHCIPVYPRFYLAGDPGAGLPTVARAVNEAMPAYAVDLLGEALARSEAAGGGKSAGGDSAVAGGGERFGGGGRFGGGKSAGGGERFGGGDPFGRGGALDGARVVVLGVAYRGGVKETAFSGAYALRDELARRGATAVAADPLYDAAELTALGFDPWDGAPIDGAIVQADHAAYASLTPADLPGARAVVDGRGVLAPEPFVAAGVALKRIGRP